MLSLDQALHHAWVQIPQAFSAFIMHGFKILRHSVLNLDQALHHAWVQIFRHSVLNLDQALHHAWVQIPQAFSAESGPGPSSRMVQIPQAFSAESGPGPSSRMGSNSSGINSTSSRDLYLWSGDSVKEWWPQHGKTTEWCTASVLQCPTRGIASGFCKFHWVDTLARTPRL